MKIVFFNHNKNLTNQFESILNPISYGLHEVMWEDGGYADFNDRYLILQDDITFESVTEEEFLKQYKEQVILEIAKMIEKNRVFFLANGTLEEKVSEFSIDKETINSFTTEEEVSIAIEQILPKYKL